MAYVIAVAGRNTRRVWMHAQWIAFIRRRKRPMITADRDSNGRNRMSSALADGWPQLCSLSSLAFWAGKVCKLDELAWTPFRHALS